MLVLLLYLLPIPRLALPHSAGTFPRGNEDRSDVDPQLRQWRNTADRRTIRLPAVFGVSEQRTDHIANYNYLKVPQVLWLDWEIPD